MQFTFMIHDAIAEFCLGVGKSRFLRQVAEEVHVHIVWTSFSYGVLDSVIKRAGAPEIDGKPAIEVVNYLCRQWLAAFDTIFMRIAIELSRSKSNGRLSMSLVDNSLSQP